MVTGEVVCRSIAAIVRHEHCLFLNLKIIASPRIELRAEIGFIVRDNTLRAPEKPVAKGMASPGPKRGPALTSPVASKKARRNQWGTRIIPLPRFVEVRWDPGGYQIMQSILFGLDWIRTPLSTETHLDATDRRTRDDERVRDTLNYSPEYGMIDSGLDLFIRVQCLRTSPRGAFHNSQVGLANGMRVVIPSLPLHRGAPKKGVGNDVLQNFRDRLWEEVELVTSKSEF